tara:strand:- start:2794 stop:4317 length:1524 start_codon:yes stop_codon:yes gene_type:complete
LLELEFKPKKNSIFFLILFISALIIRFYYFPYNLPVIIDGFDNFTYATAINYYGYLPTEWTPINNGWPIFLSFWFSVINLENTIQYMQLQKIISIILSSLITIPVYFLCKQFFDKKIALVGVALIAFDPRLILNSMLGITDPLFILLTTTSLVLFLKYDKKLMLISFILASCATIVRAEGLFLFFTLSIIFFIKYKISKEILKTYIPCLVIFMLILIPIMDYRIEVAGYDGIFQRGTMGTGQIISMINENESGNSEIIEGLTLFVKYLGWIMIPNFLIFLPLGIILFLKHMKKENNFIIIFIIICSIPILYAYLRQAQDTRYLYALFPIFSLISLYSVRNYLNKFKRKDLIIILMIAGILTSSIIFYEYKKIDYEKERELNEFVKNIPIVIGGLNYHPTITQYIGPSEVKEEWPFVFYDEIREIETIKTNNYNDLHDFISNNKNRLTHLIIDDNSNLPNFLNEIYYNEEKFNYLNKIYDSKIMNNNFKIKIFEINFEKFNLNQKLEK